MGYSSSVPLRPVPLRYIADELKSKLSVRPDDIMINTVFVDRSDWSFGNGDPWN